ncbi:MAG: DNA mismatch repair protein MutS [Clostridia bacterium]|nr:DNA mismatch repair protein MutS [Clostridia bacterium]
MALSPMMQHYLQIKEQYKDCILFYRLGDFYEMFFEDAKKVSAMLDLTLTGRDCGESERAPMCGIPYHASETYIAKLVELGEKVAICEQLTVPGETKGLVERDVIRVVSAGTMIDNSLLDEKKNNFLASVYFNGKTYSVAWADITTGDFFARTFKGNDVKSALADCLVRINPAEIISNQQAFIESADFSIVKHNVIPKFFAFRDFAFSTKTAEKALKEQFSVAALSAYGLDGEPEAVSAAGALVEYLKETQKHALKNINSIKIEQNYEYMTIDANAVRNLELVRTLRDGKRYGSLLWILDKTKTGMGSRNLTGWLLAPLQDKSKIDYRLDGVEEFYSNTLVRQGIAEILSSVCDVERLAGKISNGNVTPKDCLSLGGSLKLIPSLLFQMSGMKSEIVKDVRDNLGDYTELAKLLSEAVSDDASTVVKDGGYIKEGFNAELDELRNIKSNVKVKLAHMEAKEKEKTGIKNLRIGYNRVFGYYIEVTNSFKEFVPYNYIRKQTLANAERYVTEELKQLEEKILTSEEEALKLEAKIFGEIKDTLSANIRKLQRTAKALACLDTLVSFAEVAKNNRYARPEIADKDSALNIVGGRHPVVEAVSREQFVANDTLLDNYENRTMILTGPNMAGKSTYMRQTALIVIMAHIGSFVPCNSAVVPITDRIFTRVGASDNLIFDQSTFMVEMTEVASILLHATKNSLLVLDEVGRGTSTYDGLSIAWAVVEYITDKIRAKTLFATHYHELTELEGIMEGVKNYKITVKELNNSIVFLRKIMRGGANRSFGVEVASLAGVPAEVTERSKKILKALEKKDLAAHGKATATEERDGKRSEVENVIADIDINNLSPMQAFNILADLKEKVDKGA